MARCTVKRWPGAILSGSPPLCGDQQRKKPLWSLESLELWCLLTIRERASEPMSSTEHGSCMVDKRSVKAVRGWGRQAVAMC